MATDRAQIRAGRPFLPRRRPFPPPPIKFLEEFQQHVLAAVFPVLIHPGAKSWLAHDVRADGLQEAVPLRAVRYGLQDAVRGPAVRAACAFAFAAVDEAKRHAAFPRPLRLVAPRPRWH